MLLVSGCDEAQNDSSSSDIATEVEMSGSVESGSGGGGGGSASVTLVTETTVPINEETNSKVVLETEASLEFDGTLAGDFDARLKIYTDGPYGSELSYESDLFHLDEGKISARFDGPFENSEIEVFHNLENNNTGVRFDIFRREF